MSASDRLAERGSTAAGALARRFSGTRAGLLAVLALYLCLATVYSVVTPLYEAPDELYHYPFVKHLADGHGLPVQDPANLGPWRQEGSQPPLYYALAALVSRWAPSDDLSQLLQPYPHASVGVAQPDGHANVVLHTPREAFPYQGAALAIHLARGLSVLLGALTVLFTYALGVEVRPGRPDLALAAAAVTAFTPMFLFISGAVNNDTLVTTLATASIWLTVRALRRPPTLARWALLGAVIGLAALTKVSALGLFLPAGLALAWVAWQHRNWRILVWGSACLAGPAILIAGWWYYRNWRLYGDPLGWNAFLAISIPRPVRPTWQELWSELPGLVKTYWGVFGWVNVVAPAWFYRLCNGLAIASGVGLAVAAARGLWSRRRLPPGLAVRLGVMVAWVLVVGVLLVRWTSLTMASQGRLLFPAIAGLSYLLVLGFDGWVSAKRHASNVRRQASPLSRFTFDVSRLVSAASRLAFLPAILLAAFALWIPFGVIAPAYAKPPLLSADAEAAIPHRLDLVFGESIQLLGYRLEPQEVRPGGQIALTLYWRAQEPIAGDYTVFVHLVDQNDFIVYQRDVYPGGGAFQTSLWQPGQSFADRYVIYVPANIYNPNRVEFIVGLYSMRDSERLPIRDPEGRQLGDSISLGAIPVQAEPVDGIANPIYFDLTHKVAIVGYNLDRTALHAGETLRLTLFWRALAPLDRDYSTYARVFAPPEGMRTGTGGPPVTGAATSDWQVGRTVSETRELVIPPDVPAGVYYVDAGMYLPETMESLEPLDRWGHPQNEPCVLTRIRVLPAEAPETLEPSFTFPEMRYPLDVVFGDVARLRGFDVDQSTVSPYEPLRLTLYWEALAGEAPPTAYTVFAHLLDDQGQVIAQHDGVPASGAWPTTTWVTGQAVVDEHHLAFNEAGFRYAGEALLEIGLYEPGSLKRLTTPDGQDRVVLPITIGVQP